MEKFNGEIIKVDGIKMIDLPFNAKSVFNQEKGYILVKGRLNGKEFKSVVAGNKLIVEDFIETGLVEVEIESEKFISLKNYEDFTFSDTKMELMKALTTRRSIRKYTNKKVEDEKIKEMIAAASFSPSAHNMQPWHFVVIKDQAKKEVIGELGKHTKMLRDADVCILICGDRKLQSIDELLYADLGSLTHALLLAGHSLGLGTVWCAANVDNHRSEKIKELLNLPRNIEPFSLIACGYPAETKEKQKRFQPSTIHYDEW
ncbi:MAG: nitroreductase family protein [Anaerorhabdus sp.]